MWERYDLKEKAKRSLRANYWKTVLVAFLLTAIAGASVGASAGTAANAAFQEVTKGAGSAAYSSSEYYSSSDPEFIDNFDEDFEYGVGEDEGSFVMNNSDTAFPHHEYDDSSLPAIVLLPFVALGILAIVVALSLIHI